MWIKSLCLIAVLALPCLAQDPADPKTPLELYMKAHATGDPAFIAKAFRDGAVIEGSRPTGEWVSFNKERYISGFNGKPAPDEAQRKRSIDLLEIDGSTGVARLTLDYPEVKFTDFMLLGKIDGEWKILHKTFKAEAKKK